MKKQTTWDRYAETYDSFWVQKYSLEPSRRWVHKVLRDRGIQGGNFLDVGCGTGQLVLEWVQNFSEGNFYGMDSSLAMIEEARKKYQLVEKSSTCKNPGIFFHQNICTGIPKELEEQSFDVITCCHSFPYYEKQEEVLARLMKLLKPQGILIFIQGSINNSYDRLVFAVVELTASKANYLSIGDFCSLAQKYGKIQEKILLRKKGYMPSVCGFVMRRESL